MTIDYTELLDEFLANDPLWLDFAAQVGRIFDVMVDQPRRRHILVREVWDSDASFATKNVSDIGFDFKSSLLSEDDYRRIMEFYPLYLNNDNGTKRFVDFLGFVKNTRFTLDQLWTNDYVTFVTFAQIPSGSNPIINPSTGQPVSGGTYYPTSHVQLSFDPITSNITDTSDLGDLFYKIAPIHLVLLRVFAQFTAEYTLGYITIAHEEGFYYAANTPVPGRG